MEQDIYWEVFRDTGDPIVWLLGRIDEPARDKQSAEDREETSSLPPV